MANQMVPRDRLAALGAHLSARRFEVELTSGGLHVTNPEGDDLSDVITCRPRPEDDQRPWFFTSRNDPVAEASRIVDATVFIVGYLHHWPEEQEK